MEFPTRTQRHDDRDQRFRERMRPFIEKGGVAVCGRGPHVAPAPHAHRGRLHRGRWPTWIHRMRARLRGEDDLYRIPDGIADSRGVPPVRIPLGTGVARALRHKETRFSPGLQHFTAEAGPGTAAALCDGRALSSAAGLRWSPAYLLEGHLVLVAYDAAMLETFSGGPDLEAAAARVKEATDAAARLEAVSVRQSAEAATAET